MSFRRKRPDPFWLAVWAAAHLRFAAEDGRAWPARALWLHWSGFAKEKGAEPGSPRSFSNALRKVGAPTARGTERTKRTRLHRGVELVNWEPTFDGPDDRPSFMSDSEFAALTCEIYFQEREKYVDGREYRGIGRKSAAKLAAMGAALQASERKLEAAGRRLDERERRLDERRQRRRAA